MCGLSEGTACVICHMYNHFWLQIKWLIMNLSTSWMWDGSCPHTVEFHTSRDLLQFCQKIATVKTWSLFFIYLFSVPLSLFLLHQVKLSGKGRSSLPPCDCPLIHLSDINQIVFHHFHEFPDRFLEQSMFHYQELLIHWRAREGY